MNNKFGPSVGGPISGGITPEEVSSIVSESITTYLSENPNLTFDSIKLQDGTAVNPSYSFTNDPSTGMYNFAESLCLVKNKFHRLLLSETDIKLKDVPTKLESSDLVIGDGLLEKFKVKAFNGSTYIAGNVGVKTDPNLTTSAFSVNGEIALNSGSDKRWTIGTIYNDVPPGMNNGSVLNLTSYDDYGEPLMYPLIIHRENGYIMLGCQQNNLTPDDPITIIVNNMPTPDMVVSSFSSISLMDGKYVSITLGKDRWEAHHSLELAYYSNEAKPAESTGRLRLYQGEDAIKFNGLGCVDIPKNLHVGGSLNAYNNIALRKAFTNRKLAERAVSKWTGVSVASEYWYNVCWSPELGLFCSVSISGVGNRIMTSPDGITWTQRVSPADNNWFSVCWSSELGLFCAVAYSGVGNRVMTSPDGIKWTLRASAADNSWRSVCWSPELGLFCAVSMTGVGNRVMTSPDGITWTSQASAADNSWGNVCWSPELGMFCAVASLGDTNKIMTSLNGIDWVSRVPPTDTKWTCVCWSPELGLFCAVSTSGSNDRVMTSPDGIKWTLRTAPVDNSWNGVCWSPELGLFCSVASTGEGNRIMTSPDGIDWTLRASLFDNYWYSVCWSPELGRFCAVSNTGTPERVMLSRYVGAAIDKVTPKKTKLIHTARAEQELANPGQSYHVKFGNQDYMYNPNNFITVEDVDKTMFRNNSGETQTWRVSYTVCLKTASSLPIVFTTYITVSSSAGNMIESFYGKVANSGTVNNNSYPLANSGTALIRVPAGYYVSIIANQYTTGGALYIGSNNAAFYNHLNIEVI